MQAHIREKAEGVVRRFEEMLPPDVVAQLEAAHHEELVLLVEAALSDVYVSTLHAAAKDLEGLAARYRRAERVLTEAL